MPLIIPSNSISAGGYVVDNSCRFNSGSSDYLTRTPSGTGNRRTWTFSAWVKRTNPGAGNQIFQQSQDGSNYMKLYFSSDKIFWRGITGGSNSAYIATNRLFRDVSAWYHIVARFDSTNGTAGDRMRLYVNGVEETSFSTDINPSSNYDSFANTTNPIDIGRDNVNNASYFNGYMAEVCMVDGQSLAPDQFGEFDEDSGIWKPIDVSGLTFGTNGFYLDFENSGSLGADVSGNGNNFTVNNLTSIDQSTDTCTNNFATLNPLLNINGLTFAEGNLQVATGGSDLFGACSTIGVSQGKWYAEFKLTAFSSQNRFILGVTSDPAEDDREDKYMGQTSRSYAYSSEVGQKKHNDSGSSYGDSFGIGDIIGIALDLDNNKLYFSKNGTFQDSGDPTSGATGTGSAFDLTDPSSTASGFYFFAVSDESSSHQMTCQANFGNPPYSISSGNSDGNGYGNFEYAVPDSYLSICSANISEVLG